MAKGSDACPPQLLQRIKTVNINTTSGAVVFTEISDGTEMNCRLFALTTLAKRLEPQAPPEVCEAFFNAVATYGRFLKKKMRAPIRAAYLLLPYHRGLAMSYFSGLRHGLIDIRDHLEGRISLSEPYGHPRDDGAETWHYTLYLARLDTPGAYGRLTHGLSLVEDPNLILTLLRGINELPGEQAEGILRSFDDDTRQSMGVDGPGLSLKEAVKNMLAYRPKG